MRIECELGEQTYWVEFKDSLTRNDMRKWFDLLSEDDREGLMSLLGEWSSACFIEDVDGNEYHDAGNINEDVFNNIDYALTDFLVNVPIHARDMRSNLGKVKSGQ